MNIIFLLASSILILTCLYFIVSPYFVSKYSDIGQQNTNDERVSLQEIYEQVNELEMDYLMKKTTEDDYKALKEQYQFLANDVMKKREHVTNTRAKKITDDDKIERELLDEIHQLRNKRGR